MGEARGTLFLVGADSDAVAKAAELAHLRFAHFASAADALEVIDGARPVAIVLDAAHDHAHQTCLTLRKSPALAPVALLGYSQHLSDLHFEEWLTSGGDDLIPHGDVNRLTRRLRGLSPAAEVRTTHGIAVVADPDQDHRLLIAHVLRNAGYKITFAASAQQIIKEACAEDAELVICSTRVASDTPGLVRAARAAGILLPWIISAAPKEMADLRRSVVDLERVAVLDAFGPTENLLFLANDHKRAAGAELRLSERMLFGTTVRFRVAGTESDDVGYSFNISTGGLYIRTLAPLENGTDTWIELRPPRTERLVRLEGRVAWKRAHGPNDLATVPAGIGIEITGGSFGDLERFSKGYAAFSREHQS